MSIYIPNLELRKDSVIRLALWGDGTFCAVIDDVPIAQGKAIEVPPHGRLIDADALADDLLCDVDLCEKALCELVGQERKDVQDEKDTKQNCVYWIQNAPTIIEADKEETSEEESRQTGA